MIAEQKRLDALAPEAPQAFAIPAHWGEEDSKAVGAAGALNMFAQQSLRNLPHYQDSMERGGLWKIVCTVFDAGGIKQ